MATETIELGGRSFTVECDGTPTRMGSGWILSGETVTVTHGWSDPRFYRHGWHSWSPSRWVDTGSPPSIPLVGERWVQAEDPYLAGIKGHAGSSVGAVENSADGAIVLGGLGSDAIIEASESDLRGRAPVAIDWYVGFGGAEDTLASYAEILASRWGGSSVGAGRVWCSWYSFYRGIDQDMMRQVLGDLVGMPFDVFQMDDGWQQGIGDWQPNSKFADGMAVLASEIAGAGFRPGIWIAPFIGHDSSEPFLSHPDWFVADDDGAPVVAGNNWGGLYYGLDLTHPGARDHVAGVIDDAVSWGYSYLKLDFLYGAALPGRRREDIPREAVYRSGLELVRQVAGAGAYVLACGAPVVPSIGLCDALRIGPDVAPYWEDDLNTQYVRDFSAPATRYAISTSLSRLWLRNVTAVDPDVAYFRLRYNLLSRKHQRLLQAMCHICGFKATSDPPAWLDPEEREALFKFLTDEPEVQRLDRYRFRVDGHVFDFSEASLDEGIGRAPFVIGLGETHPDVEG